MNVKVSKPLANFLVDVSELKPDPTNARRHDSMNVSAIKASLTHFGQQKPVVTTKDKVIVAGHGLVMAAKELGWEKVAAVVTDIEDPNEIRAYAIADNKTAELSDWDTEALSATIKDLMAVDENLIEDLGFQDYEIQSILNADFSPKERGEGEGAPTPGEMFIVKLNKRQKEALDAVKEAMDEGVLSDDEAIERLCLDRLNRPAVASNI